jgi:hypothetical protein
MLEITGGDLVYGQVRGNLRANEQFLPPNPRRAL